MSVSAILWAFKHKVSTNERVVLLELANYADDAAWQCYPSMETVGEGTGLSRRSVIRAVASLANRGLISYEKRFTHHGQSSHIYTLNRTMKKTKTPCDSQSQPAVTHSHTYAVPHSHTEPSTILDNLPW
jgi:predicted transcriptional regulator